MNHPSRKPCDFRPLLAPSTVAVAGASRDGNGVGNLYIRRLVEYGYRGRIVVIHPSADTLEGFQAYPDISAVPGMVDYAFVAVPAAQVPSVLNAAAGNLRFAQVMTSDDGSTGATSLDQRIREIVNESGDLRVLGPNCLGTFSPSSRLTYVDGSPTVSGGVAVVSQSGGLSVDIVRRGARRGLGFRGVVTVGNAADVSVAELTNFFLSDSETDVLGIYVEGLNDGRAFLDTLRSHGPRKPVVVLKGGQTSSGSRAAQSHTGSLAGDGRVWRDVMEQYGIAMEDGLGQFLDSLHALERLVPRPTPTRRIALVGNGGGVSVLATDTFARADFILDPLSEEVVQYLRSLGFPPGSSFTNPVDLPARALSAEDGKLAAEMIDAILSSAGVDAVVIHLNLLTLLRAGRREETERSLFGILEALLAARRRSLSFEHPAHLLLVLRSDGDESIERVRRAIAEKARVVGMPVYWEISEAVRALAALRVHESYLAGAATTEHQ